MRSSSVLVLAAPEAARTPADLLARAGFRVDSASSVEEALACMRRSRPDAVVADLSPEGPSVMTLVRAMIEDATLATVRVVGLHHPRLGNPSLRSQVSLCDEKIATPLDPATFAAQVQAVIDRRPEAGPATLSQWGLT